MVMLKFIFGKKGIAKAETQREGFARMLGDLNEAIAGLDEKPKINIDPNTGAIEFDLPERLPDEALALPAPEADEDEVAEKAAA